MDASLPPRILVLPAALLTPEVSTIVTTDEQLTFVYATMELLETIIKIDHFAVQWMKLWLSQ